MHYRYLYINHELKNMVVSFRLVNDIYISKNIEVFEALRRDITLKMRELSNDNYDTITLDKFKKLIK